jgi:hypothetical protein
VNVTDSVQVVTPLVNESPAAQVDELETPTKSRLLAPTVSTSTVATVPVAEAVTVTLCALEITPTGCGVAKTLFCAHAPVLASSKAAKANIQFRVRFVVKVLRER